MSETTTPTLSEIALAYDWSFVTRPTVDLIATHLPTSVPSPVTRDDVLSRIAAKDDANAKVVESYRKAIAAVIKAQDAAKIARANVESVAGNLDEIGQTIAAERNKETIESRAIVRDKSAFLTNLIAAVQLDEAEVSAVEAFVTACKEKIAPFSPLAQSKSEISTARAKLRAAGVVNPKTGLPVGERGTIPPELLTLAASL